MYSAINYVFIKRFYFKPDESIADCKTLVLRKDWDEVTFEFEEETCTLFTDLSDTRFLTIDIQ